MQDLTASLKYGLEKTDNGVVVKVYERGQNFDWIVVDSYTKTVPNMFEVFQYVDELKADQKQETSPCPYLGTGKVSFANGFVNTSDSGAIHI